MQKKERKLPNRTDIPIDIPTDKVSMSGVVDNWKAHDISPLHNKTIKSFTYTASQPLSRDFFDAIYRRMTNTEPSHIKEETIKPEDGYTNVYSAPSFFTPQERLNSEIAILKHKAKELLNSHYSVGKIINEFGNLPFPKKATVQCNRCADKLSYIVDFFTHCIVDHGNSLQNTVIIFDGILDRIKQT